MKITVKTTQHKIFQVDVDPEQSVADLKAKIEESQGHPVPSQKIIFSGKILANDQSVESCGIKEKDFLVLMVSKPKQSAPAPSSIPTPPGTTSPAPAPDQQVSSGSNVPSTDQQPPSASTTSQGPAFGDTSSFLTGSHLETAIQNMTEMGFPRDQVIRALRASFNNPDRAVEYLMTGIPPHLMPEPAATPANPVAPPAPAPTAPPPSGVTPNQPQNLFQLAQQQQQAGMRGPMAPPTAPPAGGPNSDATPQMQQLRQLIAQNPAVVQSILQSPAAIQQLSANPGLAQNPEALIQALAEANNLGEDDEIPPGAQVISVTEEERAAIERLVALGFSRESAIQAYFACDKNEELAANYLFESGFED